MVAATVRTESRGHVLVVTIDRPQVRNCIDGDTARALLAAWRRARDEQDIRVLVLTGAGDEAFCSGADLKAIGSLTLDPDGPGPLGPTRETALEKPVIAAVNGAALAGGLELACLADIRLAAEHATFGVANRRWDVPLIDGGTQRLPWIVGLGRAMDLILTGRTIDAQEAHRIGLVNEVVPRGQALSRAVALAHEIAALPQASLRADKGSVMEGLGTPLADGIRAEAARGGREVGTPAFRAGVEAFGRRPRTSRK